MRVVRCKGWVIPMADNNLWQDVQAPQWQPARTAWLVTIVDLTGIILGFFVLMFSLQTLDRNSWEAMAGSFQAAFAPKEAVVAVTPEGMNNALVVVTGVKSNLSYLDSILHQRLGEDAVWGKLHAENTGVGMNSEMVYKLPAEVTDPAAVSKIDSWRRLGDVIRGWKNPIAIRVVVTDEQWQKGAEQALALAGTLARVGVTTVAGEVAAGPQAEVELVVSAQ